MQKKNEYAIVMIMVLVTLLVTAYIIYPIQSSSQYIETWGDITFQEEDYELYVSHALEIDEIEKTSGTWIIDKNDTTLRSYRIVTNYVITLFDELVTYYDHMDLYFTVNVTVSIYDYNSDDYILYDNEIIYEDFNENEMNITVTGSSYVLSGQYISSWIDPMDLDHYYYVKYVFSSSYELLIIVDSNVTTEFESDVYLLPFDMTLRYDYEIPTWWIGIMVITGGGSMIAGFLEWRHKKNIL